MAYTTYIRNIALFLFILSFGFVYSQEDSKIIEAYDNYTALAREVVYLHMNKSTYIKGENIGFKAYVLDKKNKKPSQLTTNLYVTVEDENNKRVKQKLVRVIDGYASNVFEVDSLFTSGMYTVKAFTNWMRNFNEKNHFVETIRVIDPKQEEFIENNPYGKGLDAQFLPESGHILEGVTNNIGVVIKDQAGFGIPYSKGQVFDNNNELISSFETNQFGIGKFQLRPNLGNTYSIKVTHRDEEHTFDLNQNVEGKGIVMSLQSLKSKVYISLATNTQTLEAIRGKRHTLMMHNGDKFDIMDVYFMDDTVVTKAIDYSSCAPGMNILTLFNENDIPIAERLFFNYEGINTVASNDIAVTKSRDSLTINLGYANLDPSTIHSLSISVLPNETKSYERHNNILSYAYLEPYLNGAIQEGRYYFSDINARKKYDLDNLLLTQGWSSYDWTEIFNNSPEVSYTFEQGIMLKANVNDPKAIKEGTQFMLMASQNIEPRMFEPKENEEGIYVDNVFAQETDGIFVSRITRSKELEPAYLYLQSAPNKIPLFDFAKNILEPKNILKYKSDFTENDFVLNPLDETQILDEVVLTTRLDKLRTRTRELSQGRFGRVKVITEEDRYSYFTLVEYLVANNLRVSQSSEGVEVFGSRSETSFGTSAPMTIFYNDQPLLDATFLFGAPLSEFDYIEINRSGLGAGARGYGGVLKLYASTKSTYLSKNITKAKPYNIPLKFSVNKKFYVPKYQNTYDDFYKGYGVVDWKPNVTLNSNGVASFKIAEPSTPIKLFIEGATIDGTFIYEEKAINLN